MNHGSDITTNENHQSGDVPVTAVEELLRERMRLEDRLKEHSREVSVMFTDIKGSTSFFESYGDIEGRQMVQRHNDMLFPIIEQHNGTIIKTIGDAIMATFEKPAEGICAAIQMQKELHEHNDDKSEREKIGVRIGLNTGLGIVEQKDVFGDVVNLAARVESQADAGEILVSEDTYKKVRTHDSIICRFYRQIKLKGKEVPVKVYRVIWSDDSKVAYRVRGQVSHLEDSYILDVELNDGTIRVSLSERTGNGENTVRQYDEQAIDEAKLNELCAVINRQSHESRSKGRISKDALNQLRSSGEELAAMLLTPEVNKRLAEFDGCNLTIRMNEKLVQVPWELFYIGDAFLCLKYSIGRIVSTRQNVSGKSPRRLEPPLRLYVAADSTGDLPQARKEGKALVELGEEKPDHLNVRPEFGAGSPY